MGLPILASQISDLISMRGSMCVFQTFHNGSARPAACGDQVRRTQPLLFSTFKRKLIGGEERHALSLHRPICSSSNRAAGSWIGVCIRRWSRAAKASRVRRVFESRVSIAPHLLDITVCSMVAWLLELMLSQLASVDISPGDAAT